MNELQSHEHVGVKSNVGLVKLKAAIEMVFEPDDHFTRLPNHLLNQSFILLLTLLAQLLQIEMLIPVKTKIRQKYQMR